MREQQSDIRDLVSGKVMCMVGTNESLIGGATGWHVVLQEVNDCRHRRWRGNVWSETFS